MNDIVRFPPESPCRLWSLALTDARVMAELSRAMHSDAAVDIRKYY